MKCKKLLLLPLILFLLVAGLFWFVARENPPVKTGPENFDVSKARDKPTHPLKFFDKDTFYAGLEQAKKENKPFPYHVRGGIVPHHLFPGFIIADFFRLLSTQEPKTVILLGPNHDELGNFKALASAYGWQTPFGVVEPNEILINDLVKKNLVKIDERVVSGDHAVAGMMPFVKKYLPNAQVVPILLSGYMLQTEVQVLADNLKGRMDKDTVIIAAVDFSHYLTNQQAQEKDKTTLELMESFNYQQLLFLNNDYLDNPPSVVVLLMTMQALGTTKMELLHHTNSGELQRNDSIETTSYFSIVYY